MRILSATYNNMSWPAWKGGSLRFTALLGAVLLYAVFGSPTPDQPGTVELLVGSLLIFAVGAAGAWQIFSAPLSGMPMWYQCGRILLLFGLVAPVLVGVASGHDAASIMRDVLPFLFFMLPVFFFGHLSGWGSGKKTDALIWVIVLAGVVFAARAVGDVLVVMFLSPSSAELYYFANAPTVLFAALFLIAWTGNAVMRLEYPANWLKAIAGVALVTLPVLAMTLATQRASLGAIAIFVSLLLVTGFMRYPARVVLPIAAVALLGVVAYPFLQDTMALLFQKTLNVGVNMRLQEIQAVWDMISQNISTLCFGLGWGAEFQSPAVGNLSVGYTHNLISYMLLKTGLLGTALCTIYLLGMADALIRLMSYRPALALALAAPFLIDIFLYASFKSFDFGLILMLVPACLIWCRQQGQARTSERVD